MPLDGWIRAAEPLQYWAACAVMAVVALRGLQWFLRSTQRSRLLTDLPIAHTRSASQGFARLQGMASMLAGEPVIAPLSGKPCVWYRFLVEQYARDPEHDRLIGGWQRREEGVSEAIFALDDATGRCVVDPDGAEVTPSTTVVWKGRQPRPGFSPKSTHRWNWLFAAGPYRYTESRIEENDTVGVVGCFETLASDPVEGPDQEVRQLLSQWKKDRAGLLRRFDANRDGTVDLTEWEQAQRAAEADVSAGNQQTSEEPAINVIRKPRDGRPFFLFAVEPAAVVARYRRRAAIGGALFAALATVLVWAMWVRFGLGL